MEHSLIIHILLLFSLQTLEKQNRQSVREKLTDEDKKIKVVTKKDNASHGLKYINP